MDWSKYGEPVITNVEKIDINTGKILSSWNPDIIGSIDNTAIEITSHASKGAIGKITDNASNYIKSVAKAISKFRV